LKFIDHIRFRSEICLLALSGCTIIAVLIFTYWGITNNGFHLDDKTTFVTNAAIQINELSLSEVIDAAKSGLASQRPVAFITFAFDWFRGGGKPAHFLQTNIAIHVLNALLIFALLRIILTRCFRVQVVEATVASLVGALFWALHPIQVQSVTYIVQRMTSLATTFILAALLAYLHARLTRRAGWYFLAGACAFAGALTKQIAWLLPIYLVLMELALFSDQPFWRSTRGRALFLAPILLLTYLIFDFAMKGPLWGFVAGGYESREFSLLERLLTQPRIILFYLNQVVWPHISQFSIEHDVVTSTGLTRPGTTWLALVAVAIWLVLGLIALCSNRWRQLSFFLLWPLAALSMESSFVALEMIFEHRMYVPMFGIAGLVSLGFLRVWKFNAKVPRAVLSIVSVLILGYLSLVTSNYLPAWRDERTLYEHAVKYAPKSARAWELYGNGLEWAKEYSAAIQAYTKSLGLDRENWRVLVDRGALLLKTGKVAQAEKDLNQAIEINPYVAAPYANRATIYFKRGEFDKAFSDLDMAIEIRPYFSNALHNRAFLKFQLHDYAGAREDIDRAYYYAPSDLKVIRLKNKIYSTTVP